MNLNKKRPCVEPQNFSDGAQLPALALKEAQAVIVAACASVNYSAFVVQVYYLRT